LRINHYTKINEVENSATSMLTAGSHCLYKNQLTASAPLLHSQTATTALIGCKA